jgi:hypothetical protein
MNTDAVKQSAIFRSAGHARAGYASVISRTNMGKSYDVTEIEHQSLGLVLADFHICQHCHIVDRDSDRIMVGHPCSNCGKPSPSGRGYFNLSVHTLIDLMQEFFHKDRPEGPHIPDPEFQGVLSKKNSKVAVVVFFVTLREVLLENLLYDLMIAQELPGNVCKRLFADSPMHRQRLEKLFPSLVGVTWKIALQAVNKKCELDYIALDAFVRKTVDARNTFLHRGSKYAITEKMAEECLRNIWPLLNLHVYLHNEYVAPYYRENEERSL